MLLSDIPFNLLLDWSGALADDLGGFQSFGTLACFELYLFTFVQRAVSLTLNFGIVNEDVLAGILLDEPVALGVVEPLDFTYDAQATPP